MKLPQATLLCVGALGAGLLGVSVRGVAAVDEQLQAYAPPTWQEQRVIDKRTCPDIRPAAQLEEA